MKVSIYRVIGYTVLGCLGAMGIFLGLVAFVVCLSLIDAGIRSMF